MIAILSGPQPFPSSTCTSSSLLVLGTGVMSKLGAPQPAPKPIRESNLRSRKSMQRPRLARILRSQEGPDCNDALPREQSRLQPVGRKSARGTPPAVRGVSGRSAGADYGPAKPALVTQPGAHRG